MKIKILFLIGLITLFFTGCEVEPPTPDCELNRYGTVIVKNDTDFKIEVDVTWGNVDINDERVLYLGSRTTYTKVPSGKIYLWVSSYIDEPGYTPFWTDWEYNSEYLSDCEDLTYRWYTIYYKKSSKPIFALDVIKDNKVLKTITEFKTDIKK